MAILSLGEFLWSLLAVTPGFPEDRLHGFHGLPSNSSEAPTVAARHATGRERAVAGSALVGFRAGRRETPCRTSMYLA